MSHQSPSLTLPAVVGADTLVPLTDGRRVSYANLDGAASAPSLQVVADRVAEVLPLYASVHRGAGYLSQVSTSLYEASRSGIASFVGARDEDVAVITRNTTDAINLLAAAVPGRVLVLDLEHHANLLPWQRQIHGATVLVGSATVSETLAHIDRTLAEQHHALLAVTGASNVTGEALPLDDVVAIARRHGARVFVDGAQLLAHRRLSLHDTGVDYVAFSGHKLYAPFGAGALVGRRDWLDEAEPYLAGGGAVRQVTVEGAQWAPSPARHEAGSPNVIGAAALAAACEALATIPGEALRRHEDTLRQQLVEGLRALSGVSIARLFTDSDDVLGVVTFTVDGTDPGLVAAYLSAEHGIGVRDGRFCAHPLLARIGLDEGAVRASIGLGTTADDIIRLLEGLERLVTDGPTGTYEVVDGCWTVADDRRPLPDGLGFSSLIATASAACGPAPAALVPV